MEWTPISEPPKSKGYYLAGSKLWKKKPVAEFFWDGEGTWWHDNRMLVSVEPQLWTTLPKLPSI